MMTQIGRSITSGIITDCGVNVPAASYIGDITSAITVITEEEDALGGTFATKSCQDLDCPAYTDVPVTIISHCREFGNLNAMAWPEKIAHENDLTMALRLAMEAVDSWQPGAQAGV